VLVDKAVCYSACAYAFLGGISRELGETGSYGVHQFFRQSGAPKEEDVQVTAAMLSQFLDEMGVDRRLLDLASFTKKDEMRILPISVAQVLNVDNTNPPKSKWNLDTTKNGKLLSCVTQKQSRKNGLVTFCMTKSTSGLVGSLVYLIKQNFRTQKELHDIFSREQVLIFSAADRQLSRTGDRRIRITGYSAWQPMELGTFLITFDVPQELLRILASVKEFEFDGGFANAHRDVNPGVTFSTEGLRPSIIALLNQR
jgi:hypothetical protein